MEEIQWPDIDDAFFFKKTTLVRLIEPCVRISAFVINIARAGETVADFDLQLGSSPKIHDLRCKFIYFQIIREKVF